MSINNCPESAYVGGEAKQITYYRTLAGDTRSDGGPEQRYVRAQIEGIPRLSP
jgi:hypothetical protein